MQSLCLFVEERNTKFYQLVSEPSPFSCMLCQGLRQLGSGSPGWAEHEAWPTYLSNSQSLQLSEAELCEMQNTPRIRSGLNCVAIFPFSSCTVYICSTFVPVIKAAPLSVKSGNWSRFHLDFQAAQHSPVLPAVESHANHLSYSC